jgi:hypothetical protein
MTSGRRMRSTSPRRLHRFLGLVTAIVLVHVGVVPFGLRAAPQLTSRRPWSCGAGSELASQPT